MKIGRNDNIKIVGMKSDLKSNSIEKIDYLKWIEFIEFNKDYFVWYENTEDGKHVLENITKVPDWAKEGVLYNLNKTTVYSTNKIVENQHDLVVRYFENGSIKIDIEKKMKKEVAKILLEMANYLEGELIINERKKLENIEQLN
ncbi:PH domain-containing protein [Candidatus Ornithobacterium hominis]|uniref:hypothetical protein n=1 Tax=Candidatus Ornithobacterium hominis TaxID=2497989 RepID=UPI0024BC3091|nr:hypothetical protein [Candidatus Ornithobacterium hominis]CAI9429310.1 PH domain-containing protein [Candidatus Ornithobacterium hominis]